MRAVMKSVARISLVFLITLLGPLAAQAHHSFAMFNFDNVVKTSATVEEYRWANPHVILVIKTVPKAGAEAETWSLELTSPGNLTRTGWTRKSFSYGDKIDVEFNPRRDGGHGGAFRKATILATGQVLESNLRAQEKPGLE
jgi:Family of unknown function (DUF6152)